jgi:hypothetical protein
LSQNGLTSQKKLAQKMQNFFNAPTKENADYLVEYINHPNPTEKERRIRSFVKEFKGLRGKKREHYFYVMYILYLTNTRVAAELMTLDIYAPDLVQKTYLEYASAVLHTVTSSSDEWSAVLLSFAAFTKAAQLGEALSEAREQEDPKA